MFKPYEKTFRSLEATGGLQGYWELFWPKEGQLTKLLVQQVGGDFAGFHVNIFSALTAVAHSISSGGADPDGDYASDPETYKIVPGMDSDAPGRLELFFDDSEGYFSNQDGTGITTRKHRIYVELVPQGSGLKTFDVTLGCLLGSTH